MDKQKIIVRLSFLRFGVRHFEDEVNGLLGNGYRLMDVEVRTVGFFRILLLATLQKSE